jgi:hypothetical protein
LEREVWAALRRLLGSKVKTALSEQILLHWVAVVVDHIPKEGQRSVDLEAVVEPAALSG